MKQIKTIRTRLDNAEGFDAQVNDALANGWRLTRREVLLPKAQSEVLQTHIMLYAELEKVHIPREERGCANCKHCETRSKSEPCRSCEDQNGVPDQWEAAT